MYIDPLWWENVPGNLQEGTKNVSDLADSNS